MICTSKLTFWLLSSAGPGLRELVKINSCWSSLRPGTKRAREKLGVDKINEGASFTAVIDMLKIFSMDESSIPPSSLSVTVHAETPLACGKDTNFRTPSLETDGEFRKPNPPRQRMLKVTCCSESSKPGPADMFDAILIQAKVLT